MTKLSGLEGTNPVGYLAALGVLQVASRMLKGSRLSWTTGLEAVAILHGASLAEIVEAVMADRDHWQDSPALGHLPSGTVDDVKFPSPSEVRSYLEACAMANDGGRSRGLAEALVCEFAVDNAGNAKPTDFHFTAGQQRFLRMARDVRDGVTAEDIWRALQGPWTYESKLPSFGWDTADDRVYALRARNPSSSSEKKLTEPGVEWLALQGLACFPVQRLREDRVAIPGGSGGWKKGSWTWALWYPPLSAEAATALVNRSDVVGDHLAEDDRLRLIGITKVLRTKVLRSEQGGYGSFRPSEVRWDRG